MELLTRGSRLRSKDSMGIDPLWRRVAINAGGGGGMALVFA